VRVKNSCHNERWPRRMPPYSEIAEKINIEILYLPTVTTVGSLGVKACDF